MEINLGKYFSFRRFVNSLKILSSFCISIVIRKPILWGLPLSYSIEPTNHCNLQCPECPSGLGTLTRPLGTMNFEFFERLVEEISPSGFYLQLFFQGEPYINKNLSKMILFAQKKKMYVSVSTNGHLLNESNIDTILDSAPDKIIYSIDGLDEKTYQNYRVGGSFSKVDRNLRILSARKKARKLNKPFIELQFIVMKQNEHLLNEVINYGKETGVNKVIFKTMQVTSYENAVHFLPISEKYRRYQLENSSFRLKGKIKNHCFALWRTSVVTWDGKVVPCCFDKDAEFELGMLNGKTFNEIWKSDTYRDFRRKILLGRNNVNMCSNCTAGMKMNILEVEQ